MAYQYQSDDYAKMLAPDCQHFMAMPIRVAVGYDNVIYGAGVLGGKDGVTEKNVKSRS